MPFRSELLNENFTPRGSDILVALNARHIRRTPVVKGYLFSTGFWQYWDMFAPNPSNIDTYGDALVTYKDGTQSVYWYPRMYDLPIPGKMPMERYRKFYERAASEDTAYLWLPFAQTVANNSLTDPNNPPTRIDLRYHKRPVSQPGVKPVNEYTSTVYFRYIVDPTILRGSA